MNNTNAEGVSVDDQTGLTGWILSGIGAIIATLTSVIAMFYRTQIADYKANEVKMETQHAAESAYLKSEIVELKKRADECEDDREQLAIKHARLEERVSSLEVSKKNRDSIG